MLRSSVVERRDPRGEIRPAAHAQPSGRWGRLTRRLPSLRHRLTIDRIARGGSPGVPETGSSSWAIVPERRHRDLGRSAAAVVLGSASAVDGDGQRSADIAHPVVAERA
jgi:hypothetical protein